MKKLLIFILVIILILTAVIFLAPSSVNNLKDVIGNKLSARIFYNSDSQDAESTSDITDTAAYAALVQAIQQGQERVDLSEFHLSKSEFNVMHEEICNDPSLFYYEKCSYSSGLSGIKTVRISYNLSGTELAEAKELYNNTVSEILAAVDPGWSDRETALYLHDYLASHYRYGINYYTANAYEFYKCGAGACNSYTQAYKGLLDAVGIDSVYSYTEDHIWNVICVDDEWYHVDITWDDPVPEDSDTAPKLYNYGHVYHNYFLKSDAYFKANGHENLSCSKACTSTKYDDWDGNDCSSPFAWNRGQWFFIIDDTIYNMTDDFQRGESIYIITDQWPVWDVSYQFWIDNFSCLYAYNGNLIFNVSDRILTLDCEQRKTKTIYTLSNTSKSIYGLTGKGNVITFCISKSVDRKDYENASLESITL